MAASPDPDGRPPLMPVGVLRHRTRLEPTSELNRSSGKPLEQSVGASQPTATASASTCTAP